MATGGIFQLITNDGKQDRMLMATQLLNTRLINIRSMRAASGLADPTPTLVDIERTHILFMNAHFKPFAAIGYEYNKVKPQQGNASFGTTGVQYSIPQFGDFFHDMVLHIKVGQGVSAAAWHWADFLGEKLLNRVKFEVNGNALDEYFPEVLKFHETFFVTPNKRTGWNRNVGQEECCPGALHYPADSVNAGFNSQTTVRECKWFKNGLQTGKLTHPAFELFIPLIFWFNKDPRLAIPSVSIPYGQRFITVDFAPLTDLAREARAITTCALDGAAVTFTTTPTITDSELIINNIFVNPEVHDIYIKRIGFNLIRVHRRQVNRINKASDELLMQSLKWPVETIYLGIRPVSNIDVTASGNNVMENWHRFALIDDTGTVESVLSDGSTAAGAAPDAFGDFIIHNACFKKCFPIIDKLTVLAHGIPLYNDLPAQFFNSYIPYTFGGHHVNTPEDCGSLMITFNLYPGSYQPSGHINISRAREFFIKYSNLQHPDGSTGDIISTSNPADLIVVAIAINFLLISDGSAVLRYST